MKTVRQLLLIAAVLTLLFSFAGRALAHTATGSLGAGAGKTDYYLATCFTEDEEPNTLTLNVRVKDNSAGNGYVSAIVKKSCNSAATGCRTPRHTTDIAGGNAVYSPFVAAQGANGVYDVIVTKGITAARSYTLEAHCMNGSTHTGTQVSIVANQ